MKLGLMYGIYLNYTSSFFITVKGLFIRTFKTSVLYNDELIVKYSDEVRFLPGERSKPTFFISSNHKSYSSVSARNRISSPLIKTAI